MTGPLHKALAPGAWVHVVVDAEARPLYSMKLCHDFIGCIWQIDEEHIWLRGPNRDPEGRSYLTGPHRYRWQDITLAVIEGVAS